MRHLARGLMVPGLLALASAIGMAQATKTAPPPAKAEAKAKARTEAKAKPETRTEAKPETRPETKAEARSGYRTLTGTVGEIRAGDQALTVNLPEAGAKGARAGQSWTLGVGKQTLLLRAGKNGQYSTIELGGLAKGDTVQAVVDLEADPDKSHRAWWLIAYPAGTTPPGR